LARNCKISKQSRVEKFPLSQKGIFDELVEPICRKCEGPQRGEIFVQLGTYRTFASLDGDLETAGLE
jgi:hypothetical protein